MTTKPDSFRVFLFTGDDPESSKAKTLLRSHKIDYKEIKRSSQPFEDGFTLPVLQSREGEFRGISGVEAFVCLSECES
jgi:hypothetical protein